MVVVVLLLMMMEVVVVAVVDCWRWVVSFVVVAVPAFVAAAVADVVGLHELLFFLCSVLATVGYCCC